MPSLLQQQLGHSQPIKPGRFIMGPNGQAQSGELFNKVSALRQKLSQPVQTSQQVADQAGFTPPPSAPLPPVQPKMTVGGNWGGQAALHPEGGIDKQMPAGNREGILARGDGRNRLGATQTFDQTVADRKNFNQDGRFFQGAKLSEQRGKPVFVSDEKPTFAGGAPNAAAAEDRRSLALKRLEQRDVGYQTTMPDGSKAFIGRNAKGDLNTLAGRLAAGGNSPTTLTPQQLEANRQNAAAKAEAKREVTNGLVQQKAAGKSLERNLRLGNTSPLQLALQQQNAKAGAEKLAGDEKNNLGRQQLQLQGVAALVQAGMDPKQALQVAMGVAGQPQGPQQGVPNGLQGLLQGMQDAPENKKEFGGGTMTQEQFTEAQKMFQDGAKPDEVMAKLKTYGLNDSQLHIALNKVMPPGLFPRLGAFIGDVTGIDPGFQGHRTPDDPAGWKNMFTGRGAYARPKKP